ncbi:Pectic acid lyase [Lacunisphaera limnophila]|uniref:Pectic acid lyase n=1 Tax=Lacunisphaera limnophila TaxID=1838286 RepID=A0A1D8AUC3_9BACT|nr:pectate lyase [Lacunisphaera limnophila]AOS44487.1 Pectic acid lyase [Lacunisphaera limnophila]
MRRHLLLLAALAPVLLPGAVRWNDSLRQPAEWYAGEEARAIASTVLQYQSPEGGWTKNTDLTVPPTAEYLAQKPSARAPTIDNGGTTTPLRYLARVITATGDPTLRAAFERGFDYLLAAQYDHGGWPQFYPVLKGYYSHITYNDNAMVNVLTLLRETAQAQAPFAFVDEARRARAATAVTKGITCILRTQVRQDGRLTAWCAQHDETTFAPAWARNFEPPSLSGMESVGLVKFLMEVEAPSPEIIAAIEGAVAWFETVRINGLRVEDTMAADGKKERLAVADPAASPLWARFYELGTNRPLFLGRDRVFRYDYNEIERERRTGYVYLGTWPASLLTKDYPRWRAKHPRP